MEVDITHSDVRSIDGGFRGRITFEIEDGEWVAVAEEVQEIGQTVMHSASQRHDDAQPNPSDPVHPGPSGKPVVDDDEPDELYDDAEGVEEVDRHGGPGGTEGMRYRAPDEDAEIIEREDGVVAVEVDGRRMSVAPDTQVYWVLWHLAYYQDETDEAPTNQELAERFGHLGENDTTGCMATLRRAALVDPIYSEGEDPLYGARYELSDAGLTYLKRHGEPDGYPVPPGYQPPE